MVLLRPTQVISYDVNARSLKPSVWTNTKALSDRYLQHLITIIQKV